jgi:PilZ domain
VAGNHLFTIAAHKVRKGDLGMADSTQARPDGQPERRRATRAALNLSATVREGSRSKAQVRVIDISTHGCRIECTTPVSDESRIWLAIAGLETQYSRVVWHCEEFVGLEFEKPLAEPVLERLLRDHTQLTEKAIHDLRNIATRTHWLARQAGDDDIHILAELSRQCAVDALVEGFRLGEAARPNARDA